MLITITTIVGTIIAVAALVTGIYQYRRTVHLDIFREYADKYNSIITPDMYDKWHAAIAGQKDSWEELTPTMIQYLNLIWEEFFLLETRILPRSLWSAWLPGIMLVLDSEFAKVTIDKYQPHFPSDLTSRSRILGARRFRNSASDSG